MTSRSQCDCGEPSARVSDVVAPWFGAAAMPFAARHEPFAGELALDELYPADLGAVPPGRPRTWSSSLRRMSALLRGDDEACERTVRSRSGAAGTGASVSDGADAQRWAAVTGDVVEREIRERLLSACDLATPASDGTPSGDQIDLDRFIRSRLNATIERAGENLDAFDAPAGAAAIAAFVDDLCGWYVPGSRARLLDGDAAARRTLRDVLATLAQLLAPFVPFIADEIYERLHGGEPSVHLSDWPAAGVRDLELEAAIALARGA